MSPFIAMCAKKARETWAKRATSRARVAGCKRCGDALAYAGAVFCGAACCALHEAGIRGDS